MQNHVLLVQKYKPENQEENQGKSCIGPLNAMPTTLLLTTEDWKLTSHLKSTNRTRIYFFNLSALKFYLHNKEQSRTNSPPTILRKLNVLTILIYALSIVALNMNMWTVRSKFTYLTDYRSENRSKNNCFIFKGTSSNSYIG